MLFKLPVALLAVVVDGAWAKAVPAEPTITAPAILPRQVAADWIGWVKDPERGTWTSQSCDIGGTWYRSGSYGQCCPDTATACPAPTACVGGSQIYPFDSTTVTIACTDNYNATYSICNTALIFESFGDPHPITDIVCGTKSENWSFYREVPASITEDPTATDLPEPKKTKKSSSKAWIAGAVAGPIIGIALIALVVFCLMRRKKNKKNTMQQPSGMAMGPTPGVQQAQPTQQYTDNKPHLNAHTSYGQPSPPVDNSYNQGAYNQGYVPTPVSPAPQYSQPYNAPGSPPPQSPQGAYAPQDTKLPYNANAQQPQQQYPYQQPQSPPPQNPQQPMQHPNAAELGGVSTPVGGQYTAELSSDTRRT